MNGLEQEFGERLQVARLDFDDGANRDAITALRVRGHPTTVLLDRDGEVAQTWLGATEPEELRAAIEAVVEPRSDDRN